MNAGDSYMNEDKILKINKRSFITCNVSILYFNFFYSTWTIC